MGKLLGQIFKEDIKGILPWMVLPPIAVFITLSMLMRLGENPIIGFLAGVSMLLVILAPFIALVSAAVNDWTRFYGKNAAFYSGLPFTSGEVIGARLVNFIIMGIIASLAAFINVSIMIASQGDSQEFFDMIKTLFASIQEAFGSQILILIGLFVILAGITFVSEIIFANTLGSTNGLSSLSYFAPILTFFIVNIAISIIFGQFQYLAASNYYEITANMTPEMVKAAFMENPPTSVLIIPIIVHAIVAIGLNWASFYIHDKKLSVA